MLLWVRGEWGAECLGMEKEDNGWRLNLGDRQEVFDLVVVADGVMAGGGGGRWALVVGEGGGGR